MQSGQEGDVGLRIDVARRSTRNHSILHFAVLIYHFTLECLQILLVDQRMLTCIGSGYGQREN